MTLYSHAHCPQSHRVRLVLAEKGITAHVVDMADDALLDELGDINPYHSLPTLLDRELVVYNAPIIMEYLDERYPHPPLLPVDPVARARTKIYMYRMERDWYHLFADLAGGDDKRAAQARLAVRDGLTVIAPIFAQKPYFMSDEPTLADCTLVPLLWRLPRFDITLPPQAKAITKYAERMFSRSSFQESLSSAERTLRN